MAYTEEKGTEEFSYWSCHINNHLGLRGVYVPFREELGMHRKDQVQNQIHRSGQLHTTAIWQSIVGDLGWSEGSECKFNIDLEQIPVYP